MSKSLPFFLALALTLAVLPAARAQVTVSEPEAALDAAEAANKPAEPEAPAVQVTAPVASESAPVAPAPVPAPLSKLQQLVDQDELAINGYRLETAELKKFYAPHEYKPVWNAPTTDNQAALKAFIASVIDMIDYHGLSRANYPFDQIDQALGENGKISSEETELLITDTLLQLAHDLHGDYVDLAHLYTGWDFARAPIDIPVLLSAAINDNHLSGFIANVAPSTPDYIALAKALKSYRAMTESGDWPKVSSGPTLHPGDHDERIAQIRARLAAEKYLPAATLAPEIANAYDDELKQIVITYQTRNGLQADGSIGAKTVLAMNMPLSYRIDQIIANMERLRHMPETSPDPLAVVNIPDATITVSDGGKSVFHIPVIVGKTDRKTPFIKSYIRSVIFNPAWHVPTKIARKDILPKLRKDPHYLAKLGFVINGNSDDPFGESVDWNNVKERDFNYQLKQAPGDMNSLGRIKFDFDNRYAVYLHGTPHQELFAKPERNLSSGCVRLRDPVEFAQLVLANNAGNWNLDRIKAEIDHTKTKWLQVSRPLPLYITYNTVFVDADGTLNFRNDAYGYDQLLAENLKGHSLAK